MAPMDRGDEGPEAVRENAMDPVLDEAPGEEADRGGRDPLQCKCNRHDGV